MSEPVAHTSRVGDLKQAIAEMGEPLELEPVHHFVPGMYCRELFMPAGAIIVSKIHKTEHFCVAMYGEATVVIGTHRELVRGPRLMRTLPGTERALYVHTDSLWMTFHATSKTDVAEIERDIIALDHNDPALIEYRRKLEGGVS